jgi:membrane associated rhomboid family serine protease
MKTQEQNLIEYSRIRSIFELLVVLILQILLLPVWLVLIIIGKETPKKLVQPFSSIWIFLTEAKGTFFLFCANVIISLAGWIFPAMQKVFIHASNDLFTGRVYTYITAGFIHAGIIHLAGNMLFLLIFGRIVESKLGTKKMLTVYFLALIISSLISDAIYLFGFHTIIYSLGASGAIMGLVSAGMLLDPLYLVFPFPAFILAWLEIYSNVTGILSNVNDGIGHFAHMGGFISIAFITFLFSRDEKQKLKRGLIFNAITLAIFLALTYFLGFNIIS